jgi:hypothetical protein
MIHAPPPRRREVSVGLRVTVMGISSLPGRIPAKNPPRTRQEPAKNPPRN